VGRDLTADQVLDAVRQDQAFYEESKGGVTFSGGEPLLQPRFLRSLLSASRARGLHTAVDTCGFASLEDLLSIAALADLLLYDVKSMDDEKHREFTGVSNRRILDNLIALGRTNVAIWVRVPLVPGFNDQEHELEAIAQFVSTVPQVKQVNLLPFHRTGAQKELRLGRVAGMKHVQTPSTVDLDRAAAIFRRVGLNVKTGG
jgi:pyruvate formate lyase activating enzyme